MGSTNFIFRLESEIEACESLKNDLKVGSVIKMTFLYDDRYSIVLLGPKNEVKLMTENAAKWSLSRKWLVPNGGILFLRLQKGPRRSDFFRGFGCYQRCP